jgi:hypothetical protein
MSRLSFKTYLSILNEHLLSEIQETSLNKFFAMAKQIPTKQYPFNDIFKGKYRIAIPYRPYEDSESLKVISQMLQLLKDNGFNISYEKTSNNKGSREVSYVVVSKTSEKIIPKGPRQGEKEIKRNIYALTTAVNELVKMGVITPQFQEYFIAHWNRLSSDFQNQIENLVKEKTMIITRHPIDVIRMSDFPLIRSCHSPQKVGGDIGEEGSYHYCVYQEALAQGVVCYLVDKDEFETKIDPNDFQGDYEIFFDPDRHSQNDQQNTVVPTDRIRLRTFSLNEISGKNKKALYHFLAPEHKTYGKTEGNRFFLETVQNWCKTTQKDVLSKVSQTWNNFLNKNLSDEEKETGVVNIDWEYDISEEDSENAIEELNNLSFEELSKISKENQIPILQFESFGGDYFDTEQSKMIASILQIDEKDEKDIDFTHNEDIPSSMAEISKYFPGKFELITFQQSPKQSSYDVVIAYDIDEQLRDYVIETDNSIEVDKISDVIDAVDKSTFEQIKEKIQNLIKISVETFSNKNNIKLIDVKSSFSRIVFELNFSNKEDVILFFKELHTSPLGKHYLNLSNWLEIKFDLKNIILKYLTDFVKTLATGLEKINSAKLSTGSKIVAYYNNEKFQQPLELTFGFYIPKMYRNIIEELFPNEKAIKLDDFMGKFFFPEVREQKPYIFDITQIGLKNSEVGWIILLTFEFNFSLLKPYDDIPSVKLNALNLKERYQNFFKSLIKNYSDQNDQSYFSNLLPK